MKCKDCDLKVFEKGNGQPNRYYCQHPKAIADVGSRMICRTENRKTFRRTYNKNCT